MLLAKYAARVYFLCRMTDRPHFAGSLAPIVWQALVGLLLLVWVGVAFATSAFDRLPHAVSATPPSTTVSLNGTTYELRTGLAFSATTSGPGAGVLMRVHWPEMGGYTEDLDDAFARAPTGAVMYVYLRASVIPIDQALEREATTLRNLRVGPSHPRSTSFGLSEREAIGLMPGSSTNIGRADYFEAAPSTRIFCDSELGRISSEGHMICQSNFGFRGAEVQLSFDRALLPEWRTLERRVRHLLEGLVVSGEARSAQ